jgi:hypothetical protein
MCVESHSTKSVTTVPAAIRKVIRKGPINRELDQQVLRQICEQWLHPQRSSTTLSEKPWFGRGIYFLGSAISKSNPPPPVRLCERWGLCSANPEHEQRLQQQALLQNVWHEVKYLLMCDGQHMQHMRTLHMVRTERSHSSQWHELNFSSYYSLTHKSIIYNHPVHCQSTCFNRAKLPQTSIQLENLCTTSVINVMANMILGRPPGGLSTVSFYITFVRYNIEDSQLPYSMKISLVQAWLWAHAQTHALN